MTFVKTLRIACGATLILASSAMAAPTVPVASTLASPIATVALITKGSRAGNRMQRHRTRLDRCRNVPSRC